MARVAPRFFLAGAILLPAWHCQGQDTIGLSPAEVSFRSVAGGPLDHGRKIQITAPGAWSARVMGEANWIRVSPDRGTGPGTLTISLVDWAAEPLPAGIRSGEVMVTREGRSDGARVKVSATFVAARPKARFTYANGPSGCTRPPGYEDAATCSVAGEKPPGTFAPPPPGGTYTDPNFGARVRVLSGPQSVHAYSTPTAISAQNKQVLISASGQWQVVASADGRVLRRNVPANEPRGTLWDAVRPDVLYVVEQNRVVEYNVANGKSKIVADYSRGPVRFAEITTGGGGDTSKDNWMSFFAPREKRVCALDLEKRRTFCADYENVGRVSIDPANRGTLISKGADRTTGKRYVILVAAPAMGVFSVNEAAGRLDFEYLGPERLDQNGNLDGICDPGERCYVGEHNDTFEDAEGSQYLIGYMDPASPCSLAVYSLQLNKGQELLKASELGGGARKLMTLFRCASGDVWTDFHFGCAKHAGICVVSTTYGITGYQKSASDLTPVQPTAHLGEVLVIKDNGAEIRRLMKHRSIPLSGEEARSYWSTPRACISNDGTLVALDSNFGEANRQRVVLVETGY